MKEFDEDRALARELGQAGAAVSALTLKAKLAGLIVDKKEVGKPGEFEGMNVDELRELIARGIAKLGIGAEGAGEEGEGGAPRGQLN